MDFPDKNFNEGRSLIRRWTYMSAGVVCVLLGGVGVLLPLVPTVVFLMAACFFFARSAPHLETILVRNRFFAPFLPMVDGKRRMTVAAKVAAISIIWVCAAVSCFMLISQDLIPLWPVGIVLFINLLSTYLIARL